MKLSEQQAQFTEMIGTLIDHATAMGYRMRGRDWLRSTDKLKCPSCQVPHSYQEVLFFNKRTQTLRSKHADGLAVDFVVEQADGEAMTGDDWKTLGVFWELAGGTWGGRWNPKDLGHFEYTVAATPPVSVVT